MAWSWGDFGNWAMDNAGTIANTGLGVYSLYNQQQASDASQEYMDESLASSKEYFDWWKQNIAPLQQARSISELHSMGFARDDEGNWTLPENVQDMYSQQLGLQAAQQDAAMQDIKAYNQNRGLEQEFYDRALIDPEKRADMAASDVTQAYKDRAGTLGRQASRMGLNPNSGQFYGQLMDANLDAARDVAGAKTRARTAAEDANFSRLGQAVNVRQRLGPALPSASPPQSNAPSVGARLPSGTQMQAAQLAGQSAQGYGQGAGYFLNQGFSGLGSATTDSGTGYSNTKARQLGLQPVMNNYGLGW